jgi:hypothetical protein
LFPSRSVPDNQDRFNPVSFRGCSFCEKVQTSEDP